MMQVLVCVLKSMPPLPNIHTSRDLMKPVLLLCGSHEGNSTHQVVRWNVQKVLARDRIRQNIHVLWSADSAQNYFTSEIMTYYIHTEKQTDVFRTCERVGEANVVSVRLRGEINRHDLSHW